MNLLKLFRLRSRIAKRITELENEVTELRFGKHESQKGISVYINTLHEKIAVITELKALI